MRYGQVGRVSRRSTFAMFALAMTAAAALAWIDRAPGATRSAAWIPNDSARSPAVRLVRGVPHVVSMQPDAHLAVDSSSPGERVRLLWLNGRGSQPVPGGSVVLDDEGSVLRVDDHLRVRRAELALEGREVASAAAAVDGGLWVTTLGGELLRVDASGRIAERGSTGPFAYASVAAPADGGDAWLVRSTSRFAYRLDSAPPLLARVGRSDSVAYVGTAQVPAHSLLTDLANAGSLAVQGDTVYFAPFVRDEIVAMRSDGGTLWVASRGLPQSTPDPRFELASGKPVVNYHPVNLGIAVGADGKVYVLSTPGFTTVASRLDVFDPGTGALLRSATFDTALPTVAVAADGRVYRVDGNRLLASAPHRTLERAPEIVLPLLAGGSDTIHVTGKISLVNVWASWCTPCRDEMPALDSLQRVLASRSAFRFVSVNEDVRTASARRFLHEFGFQFPVLLGHGRAKDALHYPGLPYTLLIDGDGRVVRKWIGYAGPTQVNDIRAAITTQLERSATHAPHTRHMAREL